MQVLEVGCGTGNYIIVLQSLAGCTCWGIDPSAEMLARAKGRSSTAHFQIGGAESLEFPTGFFNLVFSVDVIHHVGDRLAYLQEAYRVLQPGGQICTATDSAWIIRHRQPLATYFPETVQADLARYPRITELRALYQRVGFDETVERTVDVCYPLTDIQAYRDKAFSVLHLISKEAFQLGLARVERDLSAGPIPCVSRYTLLWGKKSKHRQRSVRLNRTFTDTWFAVRARSAYNHYEEIPELFP
jgi:ubiquinone/menaquinone biosynthesis C-methylase UbiE